MRSMLTRVLETEGGGSGQWPMQSSMSTVSLLRTPGFSGAGFYLPFIGSLFFMASDSILAIDTFRSKMPRGDVYIMSAYVTAQVLIVAGMIVS